MGIKCGITCQNCFEKIIYDMGSKELIKCPKCKETQKEKKRFKCSVCDSEDMIRVDINGEIPEIMCECGGLMTTGHIEGAPAVHYKGSTGFRTSGGLNGGWDWGKPKANPLDGHRMGKEEKKHIEDQTTKKYVKQIEGAKKDASTS